MPAISLTLQGGERVQQMLQRAPERANAALRQTMTEALLLVEADARRLVPQDTRQLMGSITHTIEGHGLSLEGRVGPSKQYGLFVEVGTRPHWPPRQALEGWARRHGIEVFLVQRAIARRGTRARPYMQPALERNRSRIMQLFANLGARIVADIEKG